jgi:hypothetical protein
MGESIRRGPLSTRSHERERMAAQLDFPPLFDALISRLPRLVRLKTGGLFVAILLNAGDAEPGETVAIDQMLPVDEFIHR